MDLSGSAMSIPDENLKLFVPLRRNLGNIELSLALLARDLRVDLTESARLLVCWTMSVERPMVLRLLA